MITLEDEQLQTMLREAAKLAAIEAAEETYKRVMRRWVRYNHKEAAKELSITPKTLINRIREGKIESVDGLISGEEIDRYLSAH